MQDISTPLIQPWPAAGEIGTTELETLRAGEGVYVWDSQGRRLIDGPAGMWCTNLGHRNRDLADAMRDQALELSYNSPWYTTNTPALDLARMIAAHTPGDLNHVFFTTGGSTAVETALRLTFYANNVLGRPQRKKIITRDRAYHGTTHLTGTLNGNPSTAPMMEQNGAKVLRLSCPDPRLRRVGETAAEFVGCLLQEFEDLIDAEGAETLAAFVAEPVMASGGVIVPPEGYLAGMAALCQRHGIQFVADEVVTGFGRLGHMFASEDVFGMRPDMITFAKGVTSGYFPLGGVAISARLMEAVRASDHPDATFAHGLTYSSHPIGAAVAKRNIELLEGGVLDHARAVAPHFQEQLSALRDLPSVADVRGMGLMACVEMRQDAPLAAAIDRHCQELGLLVRPIGNMCVMSPPLIISRSQIDALTGILADGIRKATAEA